MGIYERVKAVCAEKKVTQSKLERDLGFTPRSIYKWQDSAPSIDKIIAVADYLSVSIDNLVGRETANMYQTLYQSALEMQLTEAFNELNEEGQEMVLNLVNSLVASGQYKKRDTSRMVEKEA